MTNRSDIAIWLAQVSGTLPDDWYVVSRARHGMEAVLTAVAQARGTGEVITQPFTCATAVNPILSSGNTPVYVDIDAKTLSVNPTLIGRGLHNDTRCVIVQHTLGLDADVSAVKRELVRFKSKAIIMEDSAHTLGRVAKLHGKPVSDVSIHSFGAEKMIQTSFGGAVWLNPDMKDKETYAAIKTLLENLPAMGFVTTMQFQLYTYLNAALRRLPSSVSKSARKLLQTARLFITPIMPSEIQGKNYGKPTDLTGKLVARIMVRLRAYDRGVANRLLVTDMYKKQLNARFNVFQASNSTPLVRYPIVAQNADEAQKIFTELSSKGYTIGKWYRPLFFPGVDYTLYKYADGSCPVAEKMSGVILNLPTNCSPATAQEILNELNLY